ncbi:peptide deformylase [Gammaproteobacteria bacterium]|nr:peptide deformylase [Gammaproteobacteria bacterium]MDA8856425.1 peptide deformylase [Gammaproteobacteria bacterium]MDA9024413.1 peptide deformylase [Gammaproteobacteria bacterium]MDA9044297.1 peptide deformylase [Gammaproteobacteria bacterium]MDA9195741.1 peptide deformylase [Gammaproteobacteria bacterium]|tara:strand:- start:3208 stop:3705 length:498 start_codon:yes stop_codon:yes gene_type:complete
MSNNLKVLKFPDPRLRKVADPVTKFDKSLENLANDMLEVMYREDGIGLAATQVNKHVRLIVIDISEDRNKPQFFVNPEFEILNTDSSYTFEEGCLSVPGFNEEITRPDNIVLKWQDLKGKSHTDRPSGLLTVCIQHEIDHLEGKLMVDYVSSIKRDRIKKKLSKK